MKLHQLQALAGVVEHGGIRAAARAMHLTQAALTKALRQLEDEAGVALLVRSARGVALTDAGQRLHARAGLVIRQLALADDELRQHRGGAEGSLRVGLTPYLMVTVLGEAFRWFRKRYPRIELHLVEGLMARVLPGLRDGRLDFAIVASSGDLTTQEFDTTPLRSDRQVMVVRRGHPVLERPTAARLAQLEWVLPGPLSHAMDDSLQAMFTRTGVAPPAQLTRCDALAAIALVSQSDAVCLMPLPLLAKEQGRGLVEVRARGLQAPGVELVQLSPPGVPLTPAAAYFARCLHDAIMGTGAGARQRNV